MDAYFVDATIALNYVQMVQLIQASCGNVLCGVAYLNYFGIEATEAARLVTFSMMS